MIETGGMIEATLTAVEVHALGIDRDRDRDLQMTENLVSHERGCLAWLN